MKRFILKIILFLIPVILFLFIPYGILKKSKENFYNIDNVIDGKEKYIVGYKYDEAHYKYLKYQSILKKENTDVLVLGSSRVLQFRKEMFEKSFYNAGFTIKTIEDFSNFIKIIPKDNLPSYLIIGLDQWMFNESWGNSMIKEFEESSYNKNQTTDFMSGFKNSSKVYKDFYSNNINFENFKIRNKYLPIGLNALINNAGFRNDGSMQYGSQIEKLVRNDSTAEDYNYKDTFNRIEKGNRRFEYGEKTYDKSILILDEFLFFCKNNNIKVIGILPPFADKVYDRMVASNNYQYIDKIFPAIKPIFEKYNFELYEYNSAKSCNSSDMETVDGFHGGEKTYQKILIDILEHSSALNEVCDLKKLKKDLDISINNYVVYDY